MPLHSSARCYAATAALGLALQPALWPLPARAQEAPRGVALGWQTAHAHAWEALPGGLVLDADRGRVAGGWLQAWATSPGMRWGAEAVVQSGSLAYQGYSMLALPVSTTTRWRMQRALATVGPERAWNLAGTRWRLALAGGEERMRRSILASDVSLPTTETLRVQFAGPQIDGHAHALGLDWQATLRGQWPVGQRLDVQTYGVYDDYRLLPSGGQAWVARVGAGRELGKGFAVAVYAGREVHHFGASDGQLVFAQGKPAAVSRYPGSELRLSNWGGGLRFGF